jgi:alpha-galactosidase
MLKIHPVYRIYDYSHHKAVLSLLKAGFIKEEDVKNLVYHELTYVKNEGDKKLYGIDWNTTKTNKLYTLQEIYKLYNADLFRFCVTICRKHGDRLFPTGICTFRFASAKYCVQADADIIPDKEVQN